MRALIAGSARSKTQRVRAAAAQGGNQPDRPAHDATPARDADSAPPAPPVLASLARGIGATIAWLSGSLAAISAIFYAFGYLATLANLDMLGLDLLAFHYDPTFYIQRGADGLLLSITAIGGFWLWLFVALAIFAASHELLRIRDGELATRQPFRVIAEHRQVVKALIYLTLLFMLLWLVHVWGLFPSPKDLQVSGILYPETTRGTADPIRGWILAGDQNRLQDRYGIFVVQQAIIGMLLAFTWGSTRGWRWRAPAVAPFAIVFAISLAWLPLEYGKVALQPKFSQVLVRFEHSPGSAGQPSVTMYLLNKTDEAFVLWDARERKIVWVPSRALASAEISAKRTLSEIIASPGEAGQ
jgi:hypothetical protein